MVLNKKGQSLGFEVLFFSIALVVFAGSLIIIQSTTSDFKLNLNTFDYESSISLIAEGIVNSPNCLLDVEGELLKSNRDVISWSKVETFSTDCFRKGPYDWEATVKDKDETEGDTQRTVGSSCDPIAWEFKKSVLIKRGGEFHSGEVSVKSGNRDFRGSFEEADGSFAVVVLNTGTCASVYLFKEEKIDSQGNVLETNGPSEITSVILSKYELTPGELGTTGELLYTDPEDDYISRVTVWPEEIPNYKKSYEY